MTATKKMLAFDLGAESGRGMLGRFDGRRVTLEVIHRFSNGPSRVLDHLYWDVLRLYDEMLGGLRRAVGEHGGVDSLGVDTWGVDFALLGRGGVLLGNPRHYRDPHTEGVMESAFSQVSRERIFRQTGLQFMRFNTLFQLLALQRVKSPVLAAAETLLMMPDLFHYFFTGIKVNEFTDASTTQMVDPATRNWAYGLVKEFNLPTGILGSIVPPGTVLGPLRAALAADTGANPIPVIAPATHDTGSAVAAIPAKGKSWAFISSGTWSLMGVEVEAAILTDEAARFNFTNEGGIGGTTRLLKNIMGLWLIQECRRQWEREGKKFGYDELALWAAAAPAFTSLINPDASAFLLPPSMPRAMADFCRRTNQPVPVEPGALARCAMESLACKYRWVLERLEQLTGRRLDVIHVVGGGCQNTLLCQFTADACDRPVIAGPVEATAMGNVMVQAQGLRAVRSLDEIREVVRNSCDCQNFTPRYPDRWHEPYQRFLGLVDRE